MANFTTSWVFWPKYKHLTHAELSLLCVWQISENGQNATGAHSAYWEKCTLPQKTGWSACAGLESSRLSKIVQLCTFGSLARKCTKGIVNITIWWCLEWIRATLLLGIFSCSHKVIHLYASSKCSYKAAGLVGTTFCLVRDVRDMFQS